MLEEGGGSSSIRALKAEIEEAEGALRDRQELFMLVEGAEDGSEEPLSEEDWGWDAASDLINDKVFDLSGPNNSIATKIDQNGDYQNSMMVERAMGAGIGKHTISTKLAKGSADHLDLICSVVRDGVPCNEKHFNRKTTAFVNAVWDACNVFLNS